MTDQPPPLAEIISILARTVAEVQASALSGVSDLSLRQALYLEAVARLENPTPGDVARELRVSKPSATLAIERLAHEGYLRKVRSDADRRLVHLRLSEKGQQLAQAHEQVHQFIAGALTENLDLVEREQLARLLDKMLGAFQ